MLVILAYLTNTLLLSAAMTPVKHVDIVLSGECKKRYGDGLLLQGLVGYRLSPTGGANAMDFSHPPIR